MKNVPQLAMVVGLAASLTAGLAQAQSVPGFPKMPPPYGLGEAAPAGKTGAPAKAELDAIKKISETGDPDARMKLVDDFAIRNPSSSLLGVAFTTAGDAAQRKGDGVKTRYYYEKAIKADPKEGYALVMLAANIAQGTQPSAPNFNEEITLAQKYVSEGMAVIATREVPEGQPKDQVEDLRKDDMASGHMAQGLIYLLTKRDAEAAKEFMVSVDSAKNPDPTNLLRAAMAYNSAGQPDLAISTADRFLKTPGLPDAYKKIAADQKKIAEDLKKPKK